MDCSLPDTHLFGIGLANADGCWYIDVRGCTEDVLQYLRDWLCKSELVAFNTKFDGGFLQKFCGKWLNWTGCAYGLFKQLANEGYPDQEWNLEYAQLNVLGWGRTNKDPLDEALAEAGVDKGSIHLLDPQFVGEYCASDADAAWQLWQVLTDTCAKIGPTGAMLLDYHTRYFLTEVRLLVAQQMRGLWIDRDQMKQVQVDNERQIAESMERFLVHPDVAPHITEYNAGAEAEYLTTEPPKLTAKGEVSKRWEAWVARKSDWIAARSFNTNSKPMLAWLFFERMGFKSLKNTPAGKPSVDRTVLPLLGEAGILLANYNLFLKRRGYIAAVLEKSERDSCVHPDFNSVGAVTGRLGGSGGLNLQQMPKEKEFLKAFRARPGHTLVQLDFQAVEPTLLAEFSQDATLMALYGPKAKPNDIYLYVAAKIRGLGDEILKYYDPDNPTPEGIALAKKHCKRQRSIAKTVVLAANYMAGAHKIWETLTFAGIEISLNEVRAIHREYWRLFAGIKRFEKQLLDMWSENGGYVYSVIGRPICIPNELIKDIINRKIQTGAHDILQMLIWNLWEQGVPAHPWIVDLHDECIVECLIEDVDTVIDCFKAALAAVNAELQMGVQIKGEPQIADTLADIKIEG